jgi:hypothetical protein
VPAQAGSTYAWTATGGTITAGNTMATVTFTAGASGSVSLSCIVTNSAGSASAPGTATATIVAPPTTPVVAAPANVTANQAGYTASVPAQAGSTYAWTAIGGTITAGNTTATVTFTAGASGSVSLSCIVTNAAGSASAPGTVTATIVAPPSVPALAMIPTASYVTVGKPGLTAAISSPQSGVTFAWSISGGNITSGTSSATVTFTAGPTPGPLTLSCTATNLGGTTSVAGTISLTVVAAPVASSLVAVTNPVPFNGTTTLTPTFSNGTGSVNQGVGTVTSGTAFTAGSITTPVTYTLTVTNQANDTATASVNMTATPVVMGAISPANPTRTVTTGTTFAITPTGGATNTVIWTASTGSIGASTGVWSAPATAQAVTITATSVDDPTKTATTSVTVVDAPTVPVITAPAFVTSGQADYTASIPAQTSSTYAWGITGGTITSGTTGTSITFTAGASGSVSLSCIVTNAAATASAPGTTTATIVPLPAISIYTAAPLDVASGGASTLSYSFSGGTGSIDHVVGAVTSGGTTVVHPTSTTTYTLTVTNPAGSTTTDTVTVNVPVLPAITSFQAVSSTITVGQGTLLTFTFTGDGTIDQGVGTVTSGSQIAVTPAATTTYTLTATNLVGATVTATVTVTVKTFTSKFVYVANSGGGISGYALDDTTGALTELANSPFDEATALNVPIPFMHVAADPSGRFLFAVQGDGVVNANTLNAYTIDPATGDLTSVGTYPTDVDPWTVVVDPSGANVYVRCDGFLDAFSLNSTTGALTPLATPRVATTAGSGEVLIHPSGQQLFTVGRTSDQLQVFTRNPATGALTLNAGYSLPMGTGPLSLALSHTGEYLFTKSEGVSGGGAQPCFVYGFHVEVTTGGLTALAPFDTGLNNSDAYHGVSANPTQSVIYITLVNSTNDYTAYALNLLTGSLTPLSAATFQVFGAAGSDTLEVTRNGKWGFLTDYNHMQVAIGAIDPSTGVLTSPTFMGTGLYPVAVTVVGTVQ